MSLYFFDFQYVNYYQRDRSAA